MTRQILRYSLMSVLLTGVVFLAAAAPAHGQASGRVAANIPFDFSVGDKDLQAGKYIISESTSMGDLLRIDSRSSSSNTAVRLSRSIERGRGDTTAKLVFHRYGNQYFLAEVWGADRYGHQLIKSKQERSLERELAANPSKSDLAKNSYERIEVVAMVR